MIKPRILHFDHDHNNKFNCKCFTIIKIVDYFEITDRVLIHYDGKYKLVKVIDKKLVKIKDLSPWHTMLDSRSKLSDFMDILQEDFNVEDIFSNKIIFVYLFEALSNWITLPKSSQLV
jgi:hypothetical protein